MDKEEIIKQLDKKLHSKKKYNDFVIQYILHYKEKNIYQAIAFSEEEIASVWSNEKKIDELDDEWFSYSDDLFDQLENNNVEIIYSNMISYYNVWCYINSIYSDNMECKYGMNEYLKYCKKNNITKNAIDMAFRYDVPDAMKYYKNREIEILDTWDTNYSTTEVKALLMENNKKVANIIISFDDKRDANKTEILKMFDCYKYLPKLSKCSRLLKTLFDSACKSRTSEYQVTDEDWEHNYLKKINNKEIEKLKEEVKKYKLEDAVIFNEAGNKITCLNSLETKFNDDRDFVKDKERGR